MKVFAMSISAHQLGASVHTVMITKRAGSTEEAIGIGIEAARNRWKDVDGWSGYQCAVISVPGEWIVGE